MQLYRFVSVDYRLTESKIMDYHILCHCSIQGELELEIYLSNVEGEEHGDPFPFCD